MSFKDDVVKAINELRPALQADGGDIKLISACRGVVKVKLTGACGSCPYAKLTLANFVEQRLSSINGFKRLESI